MTVRAKFKCDSIHKHANGTTMVYMSPVTSDSSGNKTWSQYTPSGELQMNITNPEALTQFDPGKDYFIDIHPAE